MPPPNNNHKRGGLNEKTKDVLGPDVTSRPYNSIGPPAAAALTTQAPSRHDCSCAT